VRSRLTFFVLALLLAVPFFWRLDQEEFHGDESHWTSSGQQAYYLATTGRVLDPQWRDEFYFYSQPQIGKLVLGAAQALAGHQGPTPVIDYDWQVLPADNRAGGRVPLDSVLFAARIPGAIAGWLGCLLLWAIASNRGGGMAGPLAATLLASHPLWLANARRAGLDTLALSFGLAAALCMFQALDRSMRSGARWWIAAGAFTGLAAGAKYVGLLTVTLGGLAVLRALAQRPHAVRVALGALVAAAAGVLVFYATNPALYGNPVTQLRVSIGFLADQAEGMRHTMPSFRSPLWVAGEIVDRVVWPIGVPTVIELSMHEPLRPGSYGTPVVALGGAVSLLALVRRRIFSAFPESSVALTAAWVLLVFVLLALSVPTWWERWHLPLIPPLALLAAYGLAAIPRRCGALLVTAQYIAALALLPSFLNKGFGQLVMTPVGAAVHLGALALTLVTLVSLWLRTRGEASE